MDSNQIITEVKTKLTAAENHFIDELKKLRTGRAHPSMLEGVMVKSYGTLVPIIQVAAITAPEAQLLQITPFDPNNLAAIADAIRNSQSLNMNPMDDGRLVRVPIPPLTTERRQQIVKQLGEKVEMSLISARNIRHDALDDAKQAKLAKKIGEDDYNRIEKQIDDMMVKTKAEIEGLASSKEKEIMTV
ncbi:MAG: ribosome recycling factor [Candidatus Saccharibacteria bacterium]